MNKEKEMQATDLQRFIEETSNVCIRARNFVTPELAKLLEDERKLIVLRGNMRNAQQFLPFAEEMY